MKLAQKLLRHSQPQQLLTRTPVRGPKKNGKRHSRYSKQFSELFAQMFCDANNKPEAVF